MASKKRRAAGIKAAKTRKARRAALLEVQAILAGRPPGWTPPALDAKWVKKFDRAVSKVPSSPLPSKVARDVSRKAYAARTGWRDWERLAVERMGGLGVADAREAQDVGIDPWHGGNAFGWALLMPYVNPWDRAAFMAWMARYGGMVLKSWADTGLLSPDADMAPCEWREETRVASPPRILSALFMDVAIGTYAIRADASVMVTKRASAQLILQAGDWVRRKRTRRVIDIPQRY